MEVTLDKESIFKNTEMIVSTVARDLKDSGGNSIYDTVRIQERDRDFMSILWDKAVGDLTLSLCDFIECRNGDIIRLHLNERTNCSLVVDISGLITGFLSNRLAWEWMKIKSADTSGIFYTSSEDILSVIKEKLYYKNTTPCLVDVDYGDCICVNEKLNIANENIYAIGLYLYSLTSTIEQELFSMYKRRQNNASSLSSNKEISNQLTFYIRKHARRINERIAAYKYNEFGNNDIISLFEIQPDYIYIISMPCYWDKTNITQLIEEMHSYIVNASLFDYLKSNYPDESLIFSGASDASWDNIKHIITIRKPNTIHKPLQPF